MSAVNPYVPPRAAVADVEALPTQFSQPKVWSARGRIGRLRYLSYISVGYLVMVLIAGVLGAIAGALGHTGAASALGAIAALPYVVLAILAGIQRSHDMDWSGWSILLALIPLVGFVWLFKAGTPGENRFGAPAPPNTTGIKVGASMLAVLFVIGILAAIALPAYQQYTVRAKAAQMQQQQQAAPPAQQ
jgi:uncharacterized membrane protein YhaH (DUF805 family)